MAAARPAPERTAPTPRGAPVRSRGAARSPKGGARLRAARRCGRDRRARPDAAGRRPDRQGEQRRRPRRRPRSSSRAAPGPTSAGAASTDGGGEDAGGSGARWLRRRAGAKTVKGGLTGEAAAQGEGAVQASNDRPRGTSQPKRRRSGQKRIKTARQNRHAGRAAADRQIEAARRRRRRSGDDRSERSDLERRRDRLARSSSTCSGTSAASPTRWRSATTSGSTCSTRQAAKLQQVDAELAEVERMLKLDQAGAAGACAHLRRALRAGRGLLLAVRHTT